MNGFKKFHFPIPPLEIQREIVKVLDTFTELEARQKQYAYYRDELLSFDEGEVQQKDLGEVIKLQRGRRFA